MKQKGKISLESIHPLLVIGGCLAFTIISIIFLKSNQPKPCGIPRGNGSTANQLLVVAVLQPGSNDSYRTTSSSQVFEDTSSSSPPTPPPRCFCAIAVHNQHVEYLQRERIAGLPAKAQKKRPLGSDKQIDKVAAADDLNQLTDIEI